MRDVLISVAVLGFALGAVSGVAWSDAKEADAKAVGRAKAASCSGCHGLDGVARRPDVPHIAGESDIYLRSQLEAFRDGTRHHEQMSIVARRLSDEDIRALAAWYSAIRFTVTLPELE